MWPLACILTPFSLDAQEGTDESLFEEVFGQQVDASRAVVNIPIPWQVNGLRSGEIMAILPPDAEKNVDAIEVEKERLLAALRGELDEEVWQQLAARSAVRPTFKLRWLRERDIEIAFDQADVMLRIDIPAAKRKLKRLSYFLGPPPEIAAATPASRVSGYLNLRLAAEAVLSNNDAPGQNDTPISLSADGAVNVYDWVLDGSIAWLPRDPTAWQRGDLALVHDLRALAARLRIGDIGTPTVGFQTARNIVGLGISKDHAIRPYRIATPSHHRRLFLSNRARVETLVNGRPIGLFQLPAGYYDLMDFPVMSGTNDVHLRVTDDFGRVEELHFLVFHEARLLAVGETDFAWALGAPRQVAGGARRYRSTLAHTEFVRVGLSEEMTVGGNLQGDSEGAIFGLEGLWATRLGTFSSEAAASVRSLGRGGQALRLTYSRFDARQKNGSRTRWRLCAEARTETFGTYATLERPEPLVYSINSSVTSSLPWWQVSGGIGASYSRLRGAAGYATTVSLFARKQISRGPTPTMDLSVQFGPGEYVASLLIGVTWPIQDTAHFVNGSVDPFQRRLTADWDYTARPAVGGIGASAQAILHPDQLSARGGISHLGHRFEVAVEDTAIMQPGDSALLSSTLRARAASALVFADGAVGLSRPINNSFVIVAPVPTLADQQIGVNPLPDERYVAEIDALGPAVVPDLAAYQVRNLIIEAPGLPIGYDLGTDRFAVLPGFKSGTKIVVGTDATVFLRGRLHDHEGEPVSLLAGELSHEGAEPIVFFTNRTGRIRVEGLSPGTFTLRMFDGRGPIEIVVPAGTTGAYDVGVLSLPPPDEAP